MQWKVDRKTIIRSKDKSANSAKNNPQSYLDIIWIFFREKRLVRMAERKRAQAAKAMEKKSMNPKVTTSPRTSNDQILQACLEL